MEALIKILAYLDSSLMRKNDKCLRIFSHLPLFDFHDHNLSLISKVSLYELCYFVVLKFIGTILYIIHLISVLQFYFNYDELFTIILKFKIIRKVILMKFDFSTLEENTWADKDLCLYTFDRTVLLRNSVRLPRLPQRFVSLSSCFNGATSQGSRELSEKCREPETACYESDQASLNSSNKGGGEGVWRETGREKGGGGGE